MYQYHVGISVTSSGPSHRNPTTDLVSSNQLADYQFIFAPLQTDKGGVVLRCATGLGPPFGENNLVLGGWYFDGSLISMGSRCSSSMFHVRAANTKRYPGIINLYPCGSLTADEEGVYSCVIMNSSMMNQTTRVGLYLHGRSESLDMYPSSHC